MKIIFGTTNNEKIEQVKRFLEYKKIDIEFISLKDIGFNEEIIENGETIEENSLIKANAIKNFCNKNEINEIIVTDDARTICRCTRYETRSTYCKICW